MLVPKDVTVRGAFSSTRAARIRFVEAGEGQGKTPVLLIHDFCATRDVWTDSLGKLAEKFHVLAPDLPGFGASEKPDPQRFAYGWESFASSLVDFVAALGLGRIHVCGHGMGGGIALSLAAQHPSLVNKLVLASALVFEPQEHALERAGRLPLIGALLWRQALGRALFRSFVQSTVFSGATKIPAGRADDFYDCFNTPGARQAAHATLVAKADTRPLVAHLPRVTADTLVVWGVMTRSRRSITDAVSRASSTGASRCSSAVVAPPTNSPRCSRRR